MRFFFSKLFNMGHFRPHRTYVQIKYVLMEMHTYILHVWKSKMCGLHYMYETMQCMKHIRVRKNAKLQLLKLWNRQNTAGIHHLLLIIFLQIYDAKNCIFPSLESVFLFFFYVLKLSSFSRITHIDYRRTRRLSNNMRCIVFYYKIINDFLICE